MFVGQRVRSGCAAKCIFLLAAHTVQCTYSVKSHAKQDGELSFWDFVGLLLKFLDPAQHCETCLCLCIMGKLITDYGY